MAFEHRDGSGNLFKNTRKMADNHPDYKGEGKVNGNIVDIAGWIKKGEKGNFISLSIKPKGQYQRPTQPQTTAPTGDQPQANKDLPF
jgi:hypothetical protein